MEKRSPKSHMMKSPMCKSPMPKSPIPKSPEFYEKYKSRCAYGLISFFNFRHGHSKKLISDTDRRSIDRHALGYRYRKNRLDLHLDQCTDDGADKKIVMVDSIHARVKKIKRENGSIKQQINKKIMTVKVENVQSDSGLVDDLSGHHRKATKTSQRPWRLPIYGCYDVSTVEHREPTHRNLAHGDRSSKSAESAELQVHSKNERDGNHASTSCLQHDQLSEINVQANMNEAAEAFINQKLLDAKHCGDEAGNQSKCFLDALEILNSNRDLFIKLLQDPNSLLVKHIEDLRGSQTKKQQNISLPKAELSGYDARTAKECNLSNEPGVCLPLEKIVVFRPNPTSLQNCADRISHGPPQIHYSLRNVQRSVQPSFFLIEKIKLMHVIGASRKKQQLRLTDGRVLHKSIHRLEGLGQCGVGTGTEIIERNSFDKASIAFGEKAESSMDAKRKEQMDELDQSDSVARDEEASPSESGQENMRLSTNRHAKRRNKHDMYVEPRAHISELKSGNANLLRKHTAKTRDGMISFAPECDLLPMVSSRRTDEHASVSPLMRFPLCSYHQMVSKNDSRKQKEKKSNHLNPLRQNLEAPPWDINRRQLQIYESRPNISNNLFLDDQERKSISSLNDNLRLIETNYNENSIEISRSEVPSKPEVLHDNQRTDTVDRCDESGSLDSPRVDLVMKNQASTSSIDDYPSSPLNCNKFREFDRTKDNAQQPSPVSVIDQFFAEDINTPSNSESLHALPSVRLLHIDSEEHGCLVTHLSPLDLNIKSSTSLEEYGHIFKFICTVLQACHLNWDELGRKCQFSDQILDQSLLDDIDVRPNKYCDDHRLLFDYVNEVLGDVHRCYSQCTRWLSFIKPRILSAKMTGSIVHQVMNYVDWNLLFEPHSQTLEQILEKDLTKSRTWMDIHIDGEDAVSEMMGSLLEELIVEIALE